jgi:hypothetical protein
MNEWIAKLREFFYLISADQIFDLSNYDPKTKRAFLSKKRGNSQLTTVIRQTQFSNDFSLNKNCRSLKAN